MNFLNRSLLLLLSALLISFPAVSQSSGSGTAVKTFSAARASEKIKTDGLLDEEAWSASAVAGDFIMYNPYNGEPSKYRTEVRLLYDDEALYIGAMMYDPAPDSIFTELGARDDEGINADYFYIELSTYNDGLNGELFKVSASNVQIDNKLSTEDSYHRDDTWDAVWESRTRILENGWSAEIKIPYSAIRFSKEGGQDWGINFWREVRRTRETSSWNFVNKEYGTSLIHMGQMKSPGNIKPPLRLSLVPYVAGYLETRSDEPGVKTSYNGGMDLKIGLSEGFTLDATLIPDFGQVQSDDHVMNLTPYEVKYNENRPFFMEGTELFNKGEMFYSRRVGGVPHLADDVYGMTDEGEYVSSNPLETSLINATKISGRTRGGLGIGLFNAVTNNMYAEITDTITGEKRKVLTEPLTNYNMIVFDQNLPNNSFVSIANTNVIRAADKTEDFYTANVTGFETLLKTKNQLWSTAARVGLSQKYFSDSTDIGHALEFNAGKTGGTFRADYNFTLMSDSYDPNDMGYLRRNNELSHSLDFSYNVFDPRGNLMTQRYSVEFNYGQLYKPRAYTSAEIGLSGMLIFMNFWSLSLESEITPWGMNDYFEPRTGDMSKYYHRPAAAAFMIRGDTDKSKKLYLEMSGSYFGNVSEYNQSGIEWSAEPQYKINRRFSIGYRFALESQSNDIGYAGSDQAGETFFGKRDVTTVEHTLSGAFSFSAQSYLTLRGRYYRSAADYDGDYFTLLDDGSLQPASWEGTPDMSTKFFNIDMVYTWRFAPGSELSLVWKNAVNSFSDEILTGVSDNLSELFDNPGTNSISLKILYYLDYQNFKRIF